MKKLTYFLASVLVAFAISAVKQHYYEVTQTQHIPAPIEKVITPTAAAAPVADPAPKIGRASCRERV